MKHLIVICVTLIAYALLYTQAAPGGAPPEACEDLLPGHPNITLLNNTAFVFSYTPEPEGNRTFIVTIDGAQTFNWFKGFIIQARPSNNASVYETFGTFEPLTSGARATTCKTQNDTITHSINNIINVVRVRWIAPAGNSSVVFR